MILFKRVGESFRHIEGREWALLFLETIGVVAGILLAFALQEWAQQQGENAKHRQLMERLFEESELDVLVLRNWRTDLQSLTDPEKSFAIAVGKGECPPEAAWSATNTLNMYPAITAPSSVYDELMGAGGLSSVEREEVRRAIAQFHGDLDWTTKQIDYFREARVEAIDVSDKRVRLTFDPSQSEPEVWTFDREALCADQGVRNRIAAATRAHLVYSHYVVGDLSDAIDMCAALGESLGRSCVPQDGPLTGADAEAAAKVVRKMRGTSAKR